MSKSLNRVTLLGRLGKDADSKFTSGGTHVASFSVATDRSWKDKTSGEWKKETDWVNVILWRQENMAQHLTKGAMVYVEGRLTTRSYEKDGQKRFVTEVVADNLILCGSGAGQGKTEDAPARQSRPANLEISDEDVPF